MLRSISVYRHAVVNTPVARWALIARGTDYSSLPCTQRRRPSPSYSQGRRPHWTFRGLLNVHWLLRPVGSPSRQSDPSVSKAPTVSFPPRVASIATGWSDPVAGWELHPLKINTLTRRTGMVSPEPRDAIRTAAKAWREAGAPCRPYGYHLLHFLPVSFGATMAERFGHPRIRRDRANAV